jgi:hypothetical protein
MNTLERVSLSASPYRTLAWSLSLVLLGACATKTNAELETQSAVDKRVDPDAEESARSQAASEPQAPSSTPIAPPTQTYDGPSCPLHCAFARPRSRALEPEEEERLRAALAATMSGVRSCVYAGGSDGRYIKPPTLMLRFSDTNELLDMGVDTSSYEGNGESCFLSVVRGGANPDVRIDGPATVLCREHCERPKPRATASKKNPKPQ